MGAAGWPSVVSDGDREMAVEVNPGVGGGEGDRGGAPAPNPAVESTKVQLLAEPATAAAPGVGLGGQGSCGGAPAAEVSVVGSGARGRWGRGAPAS